MLPDDAECSIDARLDLLGGVVALRCPAEVVPPDAGWRGQLYRSVRPGASRAPAQPVEITAIPYYAWANRAAGPMQVWLRRLRI